MTSPSVSILDQWLATVAPDESQKLERRLRWDELDHSALESALKNEASSGHLCPKQWQAGLDLCRSTLQKYCHLPLQPYAANETRAFLDIWWPVHLHLQQWLKDEIGSESGIDDIVFCNLTDALLERLCLVSEPVLWRCFSSGRGPGAMLLAHLGSENDASCSPVRELYEQFVQQHRRDGLASLLAEFPVLGRLIGTVVALWKISTIEMLQRVQSDRSALEQTFAIPRTSTLMAVKQGLSDPHCGGRCVAILSFSQSEQANLGHVVYKPKEMGVDAAYQSLLADLNNNSELEPLRTLAVHVGDGYGYMEYVEHQLCNGNESLNRFYANAGRLTAILHLLGCTDCHHENLMACGDQLLLIDTETLFEANLPDYIAEASFPALTSSAPSSFSHQLQQSVLHSGLLPQWTFLGDQKTAVDISALGSDPPSTQEAFAYGWFGINSDGMMPGRVARPPRLATSLPVGIGTANPFHCFLDPFCDGFATQSQVLIDQRKRWLYQSTVLDRFAGLQRRIVLRGTRVYAALQRQQFEPAALRTPEAQALKLEQLGRSFLVAESRPDNWPVFAAERRQMQQLDIPFFTHRIDGHSLHLNDHGSELPGFIRTSGLQAARERLAAFSYDEVNFQISLIRAAVQTRFLNVISNAASSSSSPASDLPDISLTAVEAATRIGQQLLDVAIRDCDDQLNWLGMDVGPDGYNLKLGLVGSSLYSGTTGIACFLSELSKHNVDLPGAAEAQASIVRPLFDLVEHPNAERRHRWWRDQPLGLGGCGGVLLALNHLRMYPLAEALLSDALPRFIQTDHQLDLIGGSAGLIGALLQLGTTEALELASKAGYHLVKHQNESGSWDKRIFKTPLLGFSHGTAGFAAALACLHQRTGEDEFADAARAALAYERVRFNHNQGNWPDLRAVITDESEAKFMVAWCHGAPGIALSRACLWGTALWDEQCCHEISVATATTAAMTSPRFDHLCCGSLGLMVVLRLLASGPWPMSNDLRATATSQMNHYVARALIRCGSPNLELRGFGAFMQSGFFTGLSGIGFALLDNSDARSAITNFMCAGLYPDQ